MALSEQKKRFINRYFETLNGKQSAIYAGYSEATAKQIAYNILQEPEVEDYLEELRGKSEQKHSISKDRWLSEIEAIGFSNIQDFISQGNTVKDISMLPEEKAKAVGSIKKTVTEFDGGSKSTVEFKLHDKLNALDKIGRHFGYFEKDNDQSKPQNTNIINLGNGKDPDETTT